MLIIVFSSIFISISRWYEMHLCDCECGCVLKLSVINSQEPAIAVAMSPIFLSTFFYREYSAWRHARASTHLALENASSHVCASKHTRETLVIPVRNPRPARELFCWEENKGETSLGLCSTHLIVSYIPRGSDFWPPFDNHRSYDKSLKIIDRYRRSKPTLGIHLQGRQYLLISQFFYFL